MKRESNANRLAKECIVTALIELMKQRDYDSITITDIAKKAGVSRMAYYRNYASKDDILNKYMSEVGAEIHDLLSKQCHNNRIFDYYHALFEQLGKHSEVGVAALKANLGELILNNINKNMFKSFEGETKDPTKKYHVYFMAGAFYNVFIEWIKGGRVETPEQLATICCNMLVPEALPAWYK